MSTRPRSGKIHDHVDPPDVTRKPGSTDSSGWPTGDSSGARATGDSGVTAAGDAASDPVQTTAPEELTPGDAVGRYMILSRLGAGAMGVVYAAYDPELDRKVALKLLHPRGGSSLDSRIRLMREAKALARLSHPNVVAVHDVGTFADRVFLAMEFVDGKTLGAWLKQQPRPWQEVLTVMRKAGEGLAAAHAAGLVHRDFKPDNVLIARDGRVRVLDFGLARSASEIVAEEHDPAAAAVLALVSSDRREQSQMEAALMTRTGAVIGTPAYMSPEQHLGRSADPRSDQFSFCVAMYQALYGARPFMGERMSSLAFQVLQGKISPPPAGTAVPMWLRKVVLRGLAVDRDKRYPDMVALLVDLDHDHGRRRRRIGLAVGSALAVLAIVVGLQTLGPAREPPCSGAAGRLAGIWDPARITALEHVFQSSSLPYAADTWNGVRIDLQAYADAWSQMYGESCAATRIRGEQSDTLLDLRTRCLDRHLVELAALTDVLGTGEAAAIEKASEGVSRLGDLAACADTSALTAVVAPPVGDQKLAVDRVAADVARAGALELSGQWAEAQALGAAAIVDPAALAYPPLASEALRVHARIQRALGESGAAADSLLAAVDAGARGRDDRAVAEAWIDLALVVGFDLNQAEATVAYTRAAAAAVERAGGDPRLRAHLDANISAVQVRLGDHAAALQAAERARPFFLANPTLDPTQYHRLLGNLALIHKARGELAKARDEFKRALDLVRGVSGHDHPSAATVLTNLGALALDDNRLDEARTHADEAAAIRRRALPQGHPDLASTEELFAAIAEARGDTASAGAHYRRALEIYRRGVHPVPARLAALHNNMASLAVDDGRLADSVPDYLSAIAGFRSVAGADGEYTITVEDNLAETLLALGRLDEARALQEHVVAVRDRQGVGDPQAAAARVLQARILHALGRSEEAVALLEVALATLEPAAAEHRGRRGLGRYTLARSLADLRRDRPRQRLLAALAIDDLTSDGDYFTRHALADLRTWLITLPPEAR